MGWQVWTALHTCNRGSGIIKWGSREEVGNNPVGHQMTAALVLYLASTVLPLSHWTMQQAMTQQSGFIVLLVLRMNQEMCEVCIKLVCGLYMKDIQQQKSYSTATCILILCVSLQPWQSDTAQYPHKCYTWQQWNFQQYGQSTWLAANLVLIDWSKLLYCFFGSCWSN